MSEERSPQVDVDILPMDHVLCVYAAACHPGLLVQTSDLPWQWEGGGGVTGGDGVGL